MSHWTEEFFVENPGVFARDLEAHAGAAGDEVDALLALLREEYGRSPGAALDVACGIGRHAVELGERGVEATGVDLVPEYVDRARERAAERGVEDATAFEVRDMRDLGGLGTYDLVANMYTSFGYFDDATNRDVLAGMYDRLGPDGALVMDLANKEGRLADFRERMAFEVGDLLYVEDHEYDPVESRMHTTRQVFEEDGSGYDHLGGADLSLRLYTPVEMVRLLEDVGFGTVDVHADLEGGELTYDSTRMVVVGLR